MSQLKMIFHAATTSIPQINVAPGFRLRNIHDDELESYNILRKSVEFPVWTQEQMRSYRGKVLPDGLLLIEESATGRYAASAGAEATNHPANPEMGVLGWVMTHPDFRGHHLGRSVITAAMRRLYDAGYRAFSLLTDDFRITAIIAYLNLGWKPWLYEEDMESRWRNIATKIGRQFDSFNACPEKCAFPKMEKEKC